MNREQEIAALVLQQQREDTPFQPREPFVAFSLDSGEISDNLLTETSGYVFKPWGCPIHNYQDMRQWGSKYYCNICSVEQHKLQRRLKGVRAKDSLAGCRFHGFTYWYQDSAGAWRCRPCRNAQLNRNKRDRIRRAKEAEISRRFSTQSPSPPIT